MKDYITMLTVRFLMIKELLSETGVLWVHLDWHAAHYIKIVLDQIFGEKNFVNEVVWTYKSGGVNKRSFAKKHDTLLFYSKSNKYIFNRQKEKSYNRELKPYHFKGVEEFQDDVGWYTMVNMKDVWNIDMVGRTSGERTGYATQKPEKLLERIINSCSNEGDLCADFFSGSGTLGAVCGKLNRRWLMCDNGDVAIANQIYRLGGDGRDFAVERSMSNCSGMRKKIIDVDRTADSIELKGYNPDISTLCCSSEDVVEKYLKEDSLSVLKFWALDMNYDGRIFKINKLFDSKQRKVQIKNNDKGQKNVIIGYNVFGDRFVADV